MNNTDNTPREFRRYLRDKNRNPRGVMVATGPGKVGWSVAHPRDRFDKELGLRIARGRAEVGTNSRLPDEFKDIHELVVEASHKYLQ